MMNNSYTPSSWYWIVGESKTQVYSSAQAAYVAVTDKTYAAWLAAGNLPTNIDTEADLWSVLATAFPAGIASANTAGQAAYQATLVNNIPLSILQALLDHENKIGALQTPPQPAVTLAQYMTTLQPIVVPPTPAPSPVNT